MKHLKLIGNYMVGFEVTLKPYCQMKRDEPDEQYLMTRNFIGLSSLTFRKSGNLYSLHLFFIHLSLGYMG